MRKSAILTPVLLLIAFSFAIPALQNGYDQFQKALAKERGKGDLEGAIALYLKVVEEAKDEALAAKAQLRIGICYEKLGKQEAQKAFQKVIDNYPTQTVTVKIAKEKLLLLQKMQFALEKGRANTSLQLVWEGPDVELMGAPSPNGRYICYTDWDTGDLAIRDLVTGGKRRLTDHGTWDGSWAGNSRWSPDGKQIAYTWSNKGGTADLRIVGLDGAKSRILFQNEEFPWVEVADWSPDGRQILAILFSESRESSISLIAVSEGSARHLKKMDRPVGYMRFSPDGKYIAFDTQNESTSQGITFSTDKDIYLISAEGKSEIPLVEHPANDYLLGWTPGGRNILYTSDRSGAIDAWILPVIEGNPGREPQILLKDIGAISPLGLTDDGAFFYGHGKALNNIYVAAFDQKAGPMSATYHKLKLPYEGRNQFAEFSPDGKQLAFVRAEDPRLSGASKPPNSLCIVSLESGQEHIFPLNLRVTSVRWAPDNSSLMVSGIQQRRSFVFSVDVKNGDIKEIFPSDKDVREEMYISPEWSPDGKTVYCVCLVRMPETDSLCTIIAKDLATGLSKDIYQKNIATHPYLPLMSVSPDGAWLTVIEHPMGMFAEGEERILKVISTEDGDVRELCRFVSATNRTVFPRWSADGGCIFFPGIRPGDETWDVWYVPAAGGEPRKLGIPAHRIEHISPHPDGSTIAFSSFGPTPISPEVWVMENFLPEEAQRNRPKK